MEKNKYNLEINSWALDEKSKEERRILLEEIAENIAEKYWINKEKAIFLIKLDTSKWLDELKNSIDISWDIELKKLNSNEQERLFFILKWAQELIENSSKLEIKILKENIEKNINIEDIKNIIEDFLPKKLINKAKNPKLPHEHILGFSLWTANSMIAIIDALYQIWIWIIKAPYDLYLIISWKWEIKSIKDI